MDQTTYKPFVHLHVHSYFSILDGQAPVKKLVDLARADGQRGLALTDHGAMFGIKEFVDYATKLNKPILKEIQELEAKMAEDPSPEIAEQLKATRLKIFTPIIGCECYCAKNGRLSKSNESDRSGYHLIVLAKNLKGYKNLIKMISRSYSEGFYYRPRIDKELLEEYHEGLIVSSACLGGEVPQLIMNGKINEAKETILWFKDLFGDDYYIELQRHQTDKPRGNQETYERQKEVNNVLIRLADETGVKIIATNDIHFATEADGEAHERLICLSTGKTFDDPNRLTYTKQEWLKSYDQMAEIFSDHPEAITNTVEILNKVELYSIDNPPLMPNFPIPEEFDNADDYLRHLSYEGAKKRYGQELSQEVQERLDFELNTIKSMGFPGYFLIVQDFIAAARKLGVAVGPGRGSAAGSLVAYSLKITDLDPLKYGLLFERFLNPDRISLPDIDVDFDDDGRQEILEWVTERYGADHVAHIVTYGTMASKSSLKDVGRVLSLPLAETNALAKLIPDRIEGVKKINIKVAIDNVTELKEAYYGNDKLKHEVLDYAMQLEGTVRNTGVHACGIIIGKVPISDIVPTWITKDSDTGQDILVTQYEGSVIESTGLIKMDFLGLKTLSIIRETLHNIKLRHNIDLDINSIPIDDKLTYELFSKGHTSAVFQFESPGMQKSLMQLRPSTFEDLIAMVALYRPGPMDNIPSFIARKHGEEQIQYDLPDMEEFLQETYGITVYQEQVMLLSRKIAGFTRGESDNLRKAMGKKKLEEMARLKDKYLEGGQANGHPLPVLEKIWSEWEKFASYAFNKSHAACYAWVAYQTAYLKAHYPSEFMAGVMSRNVNNITEISKYIKECHKINTQVLCPDVNESEYAFSVNKKGDIRFGLGAIKGFSKAAANAIIEEREKNGRYTDIYDFFERIPATAATRKVCELLVLTGAFDAFDNFSREDLLTPGGGTKDEAFLDQLIKYNQRQQSEKASAQISLFGDTAFQEMSKPKLEVRMPSWSDIDRLSKEKDLLGLYLTASPLDKYALALQYKCNIRCPQLAHLEEYANKEITFGGIVTSYREGTTRTGNPYGIIKIQDYEGEGELALFSKQFVQYSNYGKEGLYIYVTAHVTPNRDGTRMYLDIKSIQLLDEVYQSLITKLRIIIPEYALTEEFYNEIGPALCETEEGNIEVEIILLDPVKRVELHLTPQKAKKEITMDLIERLNQYEDIQFELN